MPCKASSACSGGGFLFGAQPLQRCYIHGFWRYGVIGHHDGSLNHTSALRSSRIDPIEIHYCGSVGIDYPKSVGIKYSKPTGIKYSKSTEINYHESIEISYCKSIEIDYHE
jgi:hypothetical protein